METISEVGFHPFNSGGRVYGLLLRVRRQAYVFGACRRGIFWRFGARIHSPKDGYLDSTFGLRTRIKQIELMLKVGLKDEIIGLKFRGRDRVSGSMHFSRLGLVSVVFVACSGSFFPVSRRKDLENLSTLEIEGDGYYDSYTKEW